MITKKDIILYSLIAISFIFSCYTFSQKNQECYQLDTSDITHMYENYIEDWKKQSKAAFDQAEAKVLFVPNPPVVIVPMEDPDPAKCICKGTGIITHGDGHKTPCQYHGVNKDALKDKKLTFKPLIILETK